MFQVPTAQKRKTIVRQGVRWESSFPNILQWRKTRKVDKKRFCCFLDNLGAVSCLWKYSQNSVCFFFSRKHFISPNREKWFVLALHTTFPFSEKIVETLHNAVTYTVAEATCEAQGLQVLTIKTPEKENQVRTLALSQWDNLATFFCSVYVSCTKNSLSFWFCRKSSWKRFWGQQFSRVVEAFVATHALALVSVATILLWRLISRTLSGMPVTFGFLCRMKRPRMNGDGLMGLMSEAGPTGKWQSPMVVKARIALLGRFSASGMTPAATVSYTHPSFSAKPEVGLADFIFMSWWILFLSWSAITNHEKVKFNGLHFESLVDENQSTAILLFCLAGVVVFFLIKAETMILTFQSRE